MQILDDMYNSAPIAKMGFEKEQCGYRINAAIIYMCCCIVFLEIYTYKRMSADDDVVYAFLGKSLKIAFTSIEKDANRVYNLSKFVRKFKKLSYARINAEIEQQVDEKEVINKNEECYQLSR